MKKYAVSTAKSNLIHLNRFRIKNLRVVEEKLEFITDKRNLEEISKIIPLEYLDLTTSKLKTVVKKHLITIIGTLIIIFALIIQSKSIREVIFTTLILIIRKFFPILTNISIALVLLAF